MFGHSCESRNPERLKRCFLDPSFRWDDDSKKIEHNIALCSSRIRRFDIDLGQQDVGGPSDELVFVGRFGLCF